MGDGAEGVIRRALAARGTLTFREFMALALYDPEHGYYTRPGARTGREGDFSTSSDVSPAFGRRLATQAIDVWQKLGGGAWSIVELGPGRGLLAADLLRGLCEFDTAAAAALVEYVLVEVSPSLAAQQRARLAADVPGIAVRQAASLAELADGSVRGVVVANEFLDALPVHLLVRRGALVRERCVVEQGDGFGWDDREPSDPRLPGAVARYGLCARDGWQAEVCLEVETLCRELARVLDAGAACFIDYGHPAARLADEDHADGTLVAYARHRVETDLLARPGLQDLTAHVNWDHLADAARAAGLAVAGRTTQDRFLLALGIMDDLARADDGAGPEDPALYARRIAARSLVLPGPGGGKRFEALLLAKGVGADLRGLSDPFAAL